MRKAVFVLCVLALALTGCFAPSSARLVKPGDVAEVHFSCRLATGELVLASDEEAVGPLDVPASGVFFVKKTKGPVSIKAISPSEPLPVIPEQAFENEIMDRMAAAVVGMKQGDKRRLELTATELPERSRDEYVIRMPRVRERDKEQRMTIGDYQSRTGKAPEAGQSYVIDPAIPGLVEAVTQDEVVIRFSAHSGDMITTPFGFARILEEEKVYKVVIDARKGALVRSGGLVGRITEVDENFMTLDYRYTFGGNNLACDLAVEKSTDATPAQSGLGK